MSPMPTQFGKRYTNQKDSLLQVLRIEITE